MLTLAAITCATVALVNRVPALEEIVTPYW